MNYLQARQREDLSGWHFTCQNDGKVWPVGYCRSHAPHPTKEDAEECYKKYLLENHLRLDGRASGVLYPCVECGAWTDHFARIDSEVIVLCEEHLTPETFAKHWKAPVYIISS